ncbi:hypothetical protein EDB39_110104 [Vibrio crassostreae]|nr:hypothetical protein EDB52_10949 [Vibrio crassostreae]TCT47173.1 hypothetical protein EDB39_110104 [Vibrio crassostreae]TCT55780.1 hypothetical protein EDB40_111104 [Vibrio crassostreae]
MNDISTFPLSKNKKSPAIGAGEDGENESDVCLRSNSPETSSKADVLVEGLANGC